jgi:hypothetical protein
MIKLENQKGTGVCETCKKRVVTTYLKREVEIKDKIYKNILVNVCDECGDIISLPAQSLKEIREKITK